MVHHSIVDLPFLSAQGHAFNFSIPTNSYGGTPFSLRFPTVVLPAKSSMNVVGNNVKIFKVDLAGAFQKLHVDPFDV
jgi:hypothetical protein